jgi:hypothetical protein
VSAHHLRHDKTCLNCGATVEERFCSHCGQENLEPTETVGHLSRHFFEDLTHFDGKFFVTVKDLIIRPGFLTREYVAGRRSSYLNPIRMYIFISAMFFIAMFGSEEPSEPQPETPQVTVSSSRQQHLADSLWAAPADSARRAVNRQIAGRLDTAVVPVTKEAKEESLGVSFSSAGKVIFDVKENKYRNVAEYDSLQRTLAPTDSAKDGAVNRWLTRKVIRIKEQHEGRNSVHLEIDVHHDIPRIMFVLLPLFALYVGWFYRRRGFYYVNHAIFSVHYHSFVFLLFLVFTLLAKVLPDGWLPIALAGLSLLLAEAYLVAALKGMYGQSTGLSLLKGLAIGLLYVITIVLALAVLAVVTFIGM